MPVLDYSNLPLVGQRDDSSLLVGESTISRRTINSSGVTIASGSLRLTYFTAAKTENISNVRVITGNTAAAATPTLCRIGIYIVDPATNDLTLVGSTPNDTALFAAANTAYTKALSAPFTKYKGYRYAAGVLVVSAVAVPNFNGNNAVPASESSIPPRITGYSAQSDLPNTITDATLTAGASQLYIAMS